MISHFRNMISECFFRYPARSASEAIFRDVIARKIRFVFGEYSATESIEIFQPKLKVLKLRLLIQH